MPLTIDQQNALNVLLNYKIDTENYDPNYRNDVKSEIKNFTSKLNGADLSSIDPNTLNTLKSQLYNFGTYQQDLQTDPDVLNFAKTLTTNTEKQDINTALENTPINSAISGVNPTDINFQNSIGALANNIKYARENTMQDVINSMKSNKAQQGQLIDINANKNPITGLEQASQTINKVAPQQLEIGNASALTKTQQDAQAAYDAQKAAEEAAKLKTKSGVDTTLKPQGPTIDTTIGGPGGMKGSSRLNVNTQPLTTNNQIQPQSQPMTQETQPKDTSGIDFQIEQTQAEINNLNAIPVQSRPATWAYQLKTYQDKLAQLQQQKTGAVL